MGGRSKSGGNAPRAPQGPDPAAEYNKRRTELAAARDKDLSAHRARMAAGGMSADSEGWNQGLATVLGSYDQKLKELSGDPFFATLPRDKGFGAWS